MRDIAEHVVGFPTSPAERSTSRRPSGPAGPIGCSFPRVPGASVRSIVPSPLPCTCTDRTSSGHSLNIGPRFGGRPSRGSSGSPRADPSAVGARCVAWNSSCFRPVRLSMLEEPPCGRRFCPGSSRIPRSGSRSRLAPTKVAPTSERAAPAASGARIEACPCRPRRPPKSGPDPPEPTAAAVPNRRTRTAAGSLFGQPPNAR